MLDPYIECPVYVTNHFKLRLVRLDDANDLLECYSDPKSQRFFNADYCSRDFCYCTIDEMQDCIKMWIDSYKTKQFIRFAIVELQNKKAVGTIEIFGGKERNNYTAVLRIDIASKYETEAHISELLNVSNLHFHSLFPVNNIITKAIENADERIKALKDRDFSEYIDSSTDRPRLDCYIHTV